MDDTSRFVAYKVNIADIFSSAVEGSTILWNNRPLGRVNLIGTVVSVQTKDLYRNIFIDDGTGSIALRVFDAKDNLLINVNDAVNVVGRPRVFGQERYISPEIVKKLHDIKWVAVRKKEIEVLQKRLPPIPQQAVEMPSPKREQCIALINQNDGGDGADIESLVAQNIPEELIYSLIKEGLVFETKPGYVKVLD